MSSCRVAESFRQPLRWLNHSTLEPEERQIRFMQKTPCTTMAKTNKTLRNLYLAMTVAATASLFSPTGFAHVVSPEDHHAFEHKYSEVCVKKELNLRKKENRNSGNPGYVDESLQKMCDCIAQEESKTLTKDEVRKFVREGKYPMSLMIKAGQAEEICAKK